MPRPEYPSDAARRKQRPHVKVHLTTRSHRRMAEIWADPETRGMVVGLWQLAAESFAGKNGDLVHLDRTAVMWISGRTQYAHAERALRALCARLEYAVSARGALVVVEVRNFQQKQGYGSARRGATTHNSAPSESKEPKNQRTTLPHAERAGGEADPVALKFADDFLAALKRTHPGLKPPTATAYAKWQTAARLCIAERGHEHARETARWLFDADTPNPDAEFWRGVILGLPKFREKFDQLAAKRSAPARGARPTSTQQRDLITEAIERQERQRREALGDAEIEREDQRRQRALGGP